MESTRKTHDSDESPFMECACRGIYPRLCTGKGTRNHRMFPPVYKLPVDAGYPDPRYYGFNHSDLSFARSHWWALVGEVESISPVSPFPRTWMKIKTLAQERVVVEVASEILLFFPNLAKGHTILINHPELEPSGMRLGFPCMGIGNPEEDVVFPCSLHDFSYEFDKYWDQQGSDRDQIGKKCFFCGNQEAVDGTTLKNCARCKIVCYCSRLVLHLRVHQESGNVNA